jgi:hypothetical protein
MAFIIKTPIGTDRGLATNAYVRINEYRVLKTGECIFDIHIYKSKAEAILADSNIATYATANHLTCRSFELGNEIKVNLSREIIKTVTVPKETPKTIQVERTIGTKTYNVTENVIEIEPNTFQTTLKVPDWTQIQNHNIFEFGYAKLKDKLIELYGSENIEDDHTTTASQGTFAEAYAEDLRIRAEQTSQH